MLEQLEALEHCIFPGQPELALFGTGIDDPGNHAVEPAFGSGVAHHPNDHRRIDYLRRVGLGGNVTPGFETTAVGVAGAGGDHRRACVRGSTDGDHRNPGRHRPLDIRYRTENIGWVNHDQIDAQGNEVIDLGTLLGDIAVSHLQLNIVVVLLRDGFRVVDHRDKPGVAEGDFSPADTQTLALLFQWQGFVDRGAIRHVRINHARQCGVGHQTVDFMLGSRPGVGADEARQGQCGDRTNS
ncbi:hypothetical protein D3C86_1452240 [compost metagenome]